MYDGIFEDVEHVKEVLASHGHTSVDKTLVFELLEELKVRDHVVKILLGNRVRQNPVPNLSDNSWSSDRSLSPKEPVATRPDNSVYLSATAEESESSDDLEVLEHVARRVRRLVPVIEPVDLTIEEVQEVKIKPATPQPVIDLTTESLAMEVENSRPMSEPMEPKTEDVDESDAETDSEVGMEDNYYEESEEFEESDWKPYCPSAPPSPILPTLPTFDGINREEVGENRVEEMLEENNNDPNNNLEDIEVLEQNNANSVITENLNVVKEETGRAQSPKPGCSKDSYGMENTGIDLDEQKRRQASPNTLAQDAITVQNVFPTLSREKIDSMLRENSEAMNRLQIVILELLTGSKLAPIYHPKRKQFEDGCPLPIKKFAPEDTSSPENKEPELSTQTKSAPKNSIVKPAKLTIPDNKSAPLKPSQLTVPSSKPVTMNAPKKSSITLKPSKLEHYTPQYSVKIEAEKTKETEIAMNKETLNSVEARIFEDFNRLDQLPNAGTDAAKAMETEKAALIKRILEFQSIVAAKSLPRPELQKDSVSSTSKKKEEAAIKTVPKKSVVDQKIPQGSKGQVHTEIKKTVEKDNAVRAPHPPGFDPDFVPVKAKSGIHSPILSGMGPASTIAMSQNTGAVKKQIYKPAMAVKDIKDVAWREPGRNEAASNHHKPESVVKQLKKYPENDPKNYRQPIDLTGLKPGSVASGSHPRYVAPTLPGREPTLDVKAPAKDRKQPVGYEYRRNYDAERYNYPAPAPAVAAAASNAAPLIVNRAAVWNNYGPDPYKLPKPEPRAAPAQDTVPAESLQLANYTKDTVPTELLHLVNYADKSVPILNTGFVEKVDHGAVAAAGAAKPVEAQDPMEKIPPPRELINPLINMFPDVDPTYIAGLCVHANARNQGLEALVEILLIDGAAHPRIIDPEPEPAELNVDAAYENLKGLFPDAHPEYLRKMAEEYYTNQEAFMNFVQAKLENPDYPTMADYLKKIKITEQIQQYTDGFSPEKFLEIFPDPFTHFENPKRVHRYNVIAFEFLKQHFKANKVCTVQRAYRCPEHPNHLSLAAKSLEMTGPDMKSRRTGRAPITEEIPLLQEIAFIRHKGAIKEHMEARKRQEKQEFKRLKENNELLECQCCYDNECMPSKCLSCSDGHIFCMSCIKTGAATKIGEGQTQFPCFVECKGEFTLPVLQKVLEPTMFSILLRKRQEEEVKAAALEGLVSCPFCHFASIPPPEDKVFKCLNPECMKETCRLCKELNHVPLRCDEVIKVEDARHYLEEKMTAALVRKCYKCSRPFFKVEGCNKMTCPCGAMTCYICGEPVKDYRHFNGQGSDRTDLCPLWSDNQVLNAQSVRAVAEAAEKEILKKNPNLKLDTKALMPHLPRATRGPHQDIANAHVLPVHARRM